jgi:Fe-S cluster biogenesis protein NfuA
MASWFQKILGRGAETTSYEPASAPGASALSQYGEFPTPDESERRVVYAPVLDDGAEASGAVGPGPPIRARVARDGMSCTFASPEPLAPDGVSAWFPDRASAAGVSPLAEAVFTVDGVESVLVLDREVTVFSHFSTPEQWDARMRAIGQQMRESLGAGQPAIAPTYVQRLPSEAVIRERVGRVIDEVVNPGIAAHSGIVTLDKVSGNTVYIRMGGGCQGCSASEITLKQGIHKLVREAVPEVGAILDVTDHAAGLNPYYR